MIRGREGIDRSLSVSAVIGKLPRRKRGAASSEVDR